MQQLEQRALDLGVPLSVQFDLTYRCNERCVHCYLEHDDRGEMSTVEVCTVLDQLAEAGVFFLIFSGGEVFMRRDLFEILAHARALQFDVKVKTNAFMIGAREAERIRELGVRSAQVSIYSHRPEVHDAITKLPGSLARSLEGIRLLRAQGLSVIVVNVLMRSNVGDYPRVKALAQELGAEYTIDPTITPKLDGDRSILSLGIGGEDLQQVFHNSDLVGNIEEFCAPPPPATNDVLEEFPCSAGHTFCYISPYGEVYPCVQFSLPCGNVRGQKFLDIWNHSAALGEVRSIQARHLPVCSTCVHLATCTRCPGLAYTEGDMRGLSTQDCEKAFARTGIEGTGNVARASRP
jgi:radical SAM protein with 4Fe4S-binding SPASM domain